MLSGGWGRGLRLPSSCPHYQAKAAGFPVPASPNSPDGCTLWSREMSSHGAWASPATRSHLNQVQVFLHFPTVCRVGVLCGVVGPIKTLWCGVKEGEAKCHQFTLHVVHRGLPKQSFCKQPLSSLLRRKGSASSLLLLFWQLAIFCSALF